ncbi:MAG: TerB N-terminal domain-containing protein [Lachnospiraceae bacterium]|nr:TerB N-terminal domain-containing protein [Lachnospiraceae bacterium]
MDNINFDDMYYEIEYDSSPFPGAGKFVLKSQKVELKEKDPVRERFDKMRDIARNSRAFQYGSNRFFDPRVRWETARMFYKQGIFMQDFTDDYEDVAEYSSYFPNYQMMGYEQLRTYFTWRTKLRQGVVEKTSLSYAYLYLYELITNIGVADPMKGLEQLMWFWQEYRELDAALDNHVPAWIKDYHIYYDLPHTFAEFVEGVGLQQYYPELAGQENRFDLFCSVSSYDIRKSSFVSEENLPWFQESVGQILEQLSVLMANNGMSLEDSIFQPMKSMAIWQPFKDSLFFPWNSQPDKTVMISPKEIYVCSHNSWGVSKVITTERGKKLLGYIFKQTEAVLRRLTGYKHKLKADAEILTHEAVQMLLNAGSSIEKLVTGTVTAVYREATKTVVKVDVGNLQKIREEALVTQEKLTVPEEEEWNFAAKQPVVEQELQEKNLTEESMLITELRDVMPIAESSTEMPSGPWAELKQALSAIELQALGVLLEGADFKAFADSQGVMVEVLADGINEKAMDAIGDGLMDEEFVLYEDYIEEVRKLVEQ